MRISDWSSDVCSSDLQPAVEGGDEDLPLPCRDASGFDVAASEAAKAARYLGVIAPDLSAGNRIIGGGHVPRRDVVEYEVADDGRSPHPTVGAELGLPGAAQPLDGIDIALRVRAESL